MHLPQENIFNFPFLPDILCKFQRPYLDKSNISCQLKEDGLLNIFYESKPINTPTKGRNLTINTKLLNNEQ